MISFPNAKINLGLHILSRRPDGYHEIESCLYPIPWKDALEILPAKSFSFQQTGITIPGTNDDNLCVRAYQLLKTEFDLPPVQIHLHKVIPMGAGLGGGSSDCAFTLKVLNDLFQLELSDEKLESYASKLGSDCPFFIRNKPTLVTGTGTTLEPVDLNLSGWHIGLIKPAVHVSTKEAYAGVKPDSNKTAINSILQSPINSWQETLLNDFEPSIFPSFQEIEKTKNQIMELGAVYTCMSGSGSSVFGLFAQEPDSNLFHFSGPL